MTVYGMPLFLEDISGSLEGSDFVDIHGRMKLTLRCTLRDRSRAVYMVQNDQSHSRSPSAVLDFTPPGGLGSIIVGNARPMPMDQYLCKVSRFGSSKHRRFTASDGHTYTWAHRGKPDFEWTCSNDQDFLVAHYDLKTPGENYINSSGCTLTVDEAYLHLVDELLASLVIMRHIHERNL
ncbi:unnamed protein product [Peniophora sp. CBMAI 1063]|nr:unnamed protein product [Peniophora sp. CBMAI 1063]